MLRSKLIASVKIDVSAIVVQNMLALISVNLD